MGVCIYYKCIFNKPLQFQNLYTLIVTENFIRIYFEIIFNLNLSQIFGLMQVKIKHLFKIQVITNYTRFNFKRSVSINVKNQTEKKLRFFERLPLEALKSTKCFLLKAFSYFYSLAQYRKKQKVNKRIIFELLLSRTR